MTRDILREVARLVSGSPVARGGVRQRSITLGGRSARRRGNAFPPGVMHVVGAHACPCGFYGDPTKECSCSASAIARYQKRLSGPLLDRIDIHLTVPRVEYEKLADDRLGESSRQVRARVEAARALQAARFAGTGTVTNAEMGPAQVRDHCALDAAGEGLMRAAMRQLQLSARAYHRVLKLSRTIADLAGAERVVASHLAEALQYRAREAA